MVSRTSWTLVAAAVVSMAAGCGPTVNDGHCIYNRGDAGCDGQQQCMAVVGGGLIENAANGCVDQANAVMLSADRHVHVQHGLPRSLLALPPDLLGSNTVQGVLARVVEADGLERVCAVDDGIPAAFQSSDAVTQVIGIRERLDRQREQRKADVELATLSRDDADGVEAFNAEVLAWAEACAQMMEPEGGSTSDGTTGGSTGSTTDGDSSSTSTDGSGSSSGGEPCVENEDCPSATPICEDSVCVDCEALTGMACGGKQPICDPATLTCVACSRHEQCGEAACNMGTGACLPADAVVRVGPGQEFEDIESAISDTSDYPDGLTILIYEADTPYTDTVEVSSTQTYAFLAAEGQAPEWGAPGTRQLRVRGTAFVQGIRLTNNSLSEALWVSDGSAWVDQAWITGNMLGILIWRGQATVRNTFVTTETSDGYAVGISDTSTLTLVASTVTSSANEPLAAPITCGSDSKVLVRNSLVVGSTDVAPQCPSAWFRNSAVTGKVRGRANWDAGPLLPKVFVDYPDDLHLVPAIAGVLATIARWEVGDPPVDIDGDPRPTVDGTMDYVGADVP